VTTNNNDSRTDVSADNEIGAGQSVVSEEESELRAWFANYGPPVVTQSLHMDYDQIFRQAVNRVAPTSRRKTTPQSNRDPFYS
jgi:hypothetical protein